ncbi:hypothetical protein [Nocardiopsis sp. MG754419]|uniref:hypothetical protein n=1 Tax=Nocardiopsis sp. MG754419 TaxID=2259865 RepID=UPI0027DABD5B|nr:hypothetical protein [Nocardiopsis sp. MG754419]
MPTTTTHSRRATALCGAVLLLATACSDGHGHSPQQLSEMIAETVRDSADTGLPGLGGSDTLYDPNDFACAPAVDPEVPGSWRSHAPRVPVEEDASAEIGLTDADGDHAGTVVATVTDPDGATTTAESDLVEDAWSHLVYPDDFDLDSTTVGVHTVLWSDAATGALITCDGFEID